MLGRTRALGAADGWGLSETVGLYFSPWEGTCLPSKEARSPAAGGRPSCELGTHSAAVRMTGQLPRGTDEVFSTICDQMNGSVKRALTDGHGRRS